MDARMQKNRVTRWLVGLVAALQLVLFATPSPAQAAIESVPPISGGTVWRPSWKKGSFPSAVATCSSLSPSDCPVCGSLTYVGIQPNRAYPSYMDCMFFFKPGDGTPGWNTLSGTAIPYSNAVCPVPTVNPTVSYQYKASSGMCERESQCIAPNAVNPATGKCEPPETYTITLTPDRPTTEPSQALRFTVTVKNQNEQLPASPVTVHLALAVGATSGGHPHGDSTRPRGELNAVKCTSDAPCIDVTTGTPDNGTGSFTFQPTDASGTHTITPSCDKCSGKPVSVNVKVDNLIPIPASPTLYALTDSTGWVIGAVKNVHTDNHYLTTAAIGKLGNLAILYKTKVNSKVVLYLNDASLEWGGLFDVDIDNPWSTPHTSHDIGTSLDIRAQNSFPIKEGAVPITDFLKFITESKKNHFRVALHCKGSTQTSVCYGKLDNRHFHVDF